MPTNSQVPTNQHLHFPPLTPYQVPAYTLSFDVKKHAEVGVLIAVIDAASYVATFSEAVL